MVISKNKVVALSYELRLDGENKKTIETVPRENPLTFVYAVGGMLPKFEEKIKGLGKGDTFDFVLQPKEAYGEFSEKRLIDLPISLFKENGQLNHDLLQTGKFIIMRDTAGKRLRGKVLKVNNDSVKVDFNHPLAGKDLHFKGEVISIREATQTEMQNGMVDHQCTNCGRH